jgi:hypothetical protein
MTGCVAVLVGIHGPFPPPKEGKEKIATSTSLLMPGGASVGGLSAGLGGNAPAAPAVGPTTTTLMQGPPKPLLGQRTGAAPHAGSSSSSSLQPVQNEFEDEDDDDEDDE